MGEEALSWIASMQSIAAAGDKTLIDYLRGTDSYRTGRWQGYREDLQATIDLGKAQQ